MGLFHAIGVFEPITKNMIHPDVCQPDQGELDAECVAAEIAEQRQKDREDDGETSSSGDREDDDEGSSSEPSTDEDAPDRG